MTNPLFLIAQPLLYDYNSFFEIAVSKISRSLNCVDVLISSVVENSSHLNIILLSSYTQIRKHLLDSGFTYEFQINVYLNRITSKSCEYQVFHIENERIPTFLNDFDRISVHVAPSSILVKPNNTSQSVNYRSIDTVAVGGTFDHLHDGHKILLLMAVFAAKSKLIIGITGPELLKGKKYSSVMQPLELRIETVCTFLRNFLQRGQRYEVYQINDVCGPTGFISGINSLVISEETIKGATFVNSFRVEAGFMPLQIICVNVIGGDGTLDNNWSGKLSSTEIRKLEFEKRNRQL